MRQNVHNGEHCSPDEWLDRRAVPPDANAAATPVRDGSSPRLVLTPEVMEQSETALSKSGRMPFASLASQSGLAGGLVVLFGIAVLYATRDLSIGRLGAMGPGFMPVVLSVGTIILGLALWVLGVMEREAAVAVTPSALRRLVFPPLFIVGAILFFSATIRGIAFASVDIPALGMLVAVPGAMIIGGLASSETRWRELILFTAVTSLFCAGLFKIALRLPIPLAPWLLGY